MRYVNNGTYGCVISPNLPCSNTRSNDKYVSKVFSSSRSALEEVEQMKIIQKIDPYNRFTIKMYESCNVDAFNTIPEEEMIKCKNFQKYTHIPGKQQIQLIYENGGVDLAHVKDVMFEDLFVDMQPLFAGLKVMNDNKVTHYDIKPGNIVYNDKTRKMKYIDFGLLHSTSINYNFELFIQKYGSMQPFVSYTYYYYPPEFQLYNSYKFESWQNVNSVVMDARKHDSYNNYTQGYNLLYKVYLTNVVAKVGDICPEIANELRLLVDNGLKSKRRKRFLEMVRDLGMTEGEDYFYKIENKVDVYSLGISVLQVFSMFLHNGMVDLLGNKVFYKKFFYMLFAMTNFNPMKRIHPDKLYVLYKTLATLLRRQSTQRTKYLPRYVLNPFENKMIKSKSKTFQSLLKRHGWGFWLKKSH